MFTSWNLPKEGLFTSKKKKPPKKKKSFSLSLNLNSWKKKILIILLFLNARVKLRLQISSSFLSLSFQFLSFLLFPTKPTYTLLQIRYLLFYEFGFGAIPLWIRGAIHYPSLTTFFHFLLFLLLLFTFLNFFLNIF